MHKAVTGRQSSGTGGCLPYPFLGHRTTFACEKERWFPRSHQVTGVLSTPLQLSFPGRTWLLLFKVPCTSAYAPTSLLSYLWEKLENAQWHTGELVPSVHVVEKSSSLEFSGGKIGDIPMTNVVYISAKFQQAKREEEGSKQALGKWVVWNEWVLLPGRLRTVVTWMRMSLPIGSQSWCLVPNQRTL